MHLQRRKIAPGGFETEALTRQTYSADARTIAPLDVLPVGICTTVYRLITNRALRSHRPKELEGEAFFRNSINFPCYCWTAGRLICLSEATLYTLGKVKNSFGSRLYMGQLASTTGSADAESSVLILRSASQTTVLDRITGG